MLYKFIDRKEIIERVSHIRMLHRGIAPTTDREQNLQERRNQKAKDLLSNLRRTGEHPMLSMVLEFGDMHSLTADGAHSLFGYHLDTIREYDLLLNGGRTHIKCTHKRLGPREIHRPLGVGNTCESESEKHRQQLAKVELEPPGK